MNELAKKRPKQTSHALWIVTAVSLVLFALLSVGIRTGALAGFDHGILMLVRSIAGPVLNEWVPLVTNLGGIFVVCGVTVLVGLWLAHKRRWTTLTILLAGVAGSSALAYLLKSLVDRARPDLWSHLVLETSNSFPSGHATASATLALCIIAIYWRTKWRNLVIALSAIYIVIIAFTRLYAGVHYPSDILAGWILAVGWVAAIVALASRRDRPQTSSQ